VKRKDYQRKKARDFSIGRKFSAYISYDLHVRFYH
jgi:hypothetical protein